MSVTCSNCKHLNSEADFYCQDCKGKLSAVPAEGLFFNRYLIENRLSENTVSISFAAKDVRNGIPCVLREFLPQKNDSLLLKAVSARYITVARELGAESLRCGARVLTVFVHERRFYAIEEAIEGVALASLRGSQARLNDDKLREWFEAVLQMLEAWRSQVPPAVHGDLRAARLIRRRQDGSIAAIEWAALEDLTQIIHVSEQTLTPSIEHMPAWAPPERKRLQLVPASDLYGAAVATLELHTGLTCDKLFDPNRQEWQWSLMNGSPGTEMSGALMTTLTWMLEPQIERRPSSPDAARECLEQLDRATRLQKQGEHDQALKEFRTAFAKVKSSWLRARITESEKSIAELQEESRKARPMSAADPPVPTPTSVTPSTFVLPGVSETLPVQQFSETAKPKDETVPVAVLHRDSRKVLGLVLGIGAGLLVIVGIALYLQSRVGPKITALIDSGNVVSPVGASAFDVFLQAQQSSSLSVGEMSDIAAKVIPKIEVDGNKVIQEYHDTSNVSDEAWDNVKRMFQWASMLRPANSEYRAKMAYALGQTRLVRGSLSDAGTAFSEATNSGCWSLAFNGLGRVAYRQKRFNDAVAFYQRAIQCEPNWVYPHQNLCALLVQMNNLSGAEVACRRTVELDNRRALAHFELGVIYEHDKRLCDAAHAYQSALQVAEPGNRSFNADRVQKKVQQLTAKGKCG